MTSALLPGQELELLADRWVQQGFCLAHDPNSGLPVFIHGALPGETVQVRITRAKKKHAFGLVVNVRQAAPERIESDCSTFPLCGGCSFRHLDYDKELQIKQDLLSEWQHLETSPGSKKFQIQHADPIAYRNAVQLHVDQAQTGYFALHSNDIVALPPEGCRLISDRLNQFIRTDHWQAKRPFFRELDSGPILARSDSLLQQKVTLPNGTKIDWSFAAQGFWQVNRYLWPQWLQTIHEWIGQISPNQKWHLLELFCGSALIGGFVHEYWQSYLGLEQSKPALKAAELNLNQMGLQFELQVADLYQAPVHWPKRCNAVIANPPRNGLAGWMAPALGSSPVEWILYSSCNPATLNRDLKALKENGFGISSATGFDFFARTPHLEVLVLLQKSHL